MAAPRRRGWAFSPFGFLRRVVAGAYEDNIPFLASALTFDALLATVPFVLLLLGAFGYMAHGGGEAREDVLRLFAQLTPSAAPGEASPLAPAERLLAGVAESRTQLSLLGVPLFLWFATRLFSGARAALNEVFDTRETRPYFLGKGLDLLLVLGALVLVLGNLVLAILLQDLPWFGRFVGTITTFAMGAVLFYLVYTVAPSRKVPWDTALVAAAVASLGFEIAKSLYGLYLTNFATLDRLISNANAIAVLLLVLWIYYTAVVFLIGGEVAETYDLMRRQRDQRAILA